MRALILAFLLLPLTVTNSALAAERYRAVLELTPAAPLPFLSKFGTVDVTLYPAGLRFDTLVLDGFSRNGATAVTLENPVTRMYTEVSVARIRPLLLAVAGGANEVLPGLPHYSIDSRVSVGTVKGVAAKRYRVVLGPHAYIDVWTTDAFGRNPQFTALVYECVKALSVPAAGLVRQIPDTPVYVEMNTARFPKLVLLRMKEFSRTSNGEADDLTVGDFMVKVPLLEKLLK